MSKITAKGRTFFSDAMIEITGSKMVKRIKSVDPILEDYVRLAISRRRGVIANAYHPPANTMLQAYALMANLFGEKNITVEGDIGSIEYQPDRIY